MTRFDLTPLYRSTIGFDGLADVFNAFYAAEKNAAKGQSYPPYNVERLDDTQYQISMAVAGFDEADLDIEQVGSTLIIRGMVREAANNDRDAYLYRGIARRDFERRFQLADNVKVKGAALDKGLLHIALEREIPESEKPRKIDIAKTLRAA